MPRRTHGHLVEAHRWPDVARYEAGFEDLDDLHSLMHDPERFGEAVSLLRGILGIPAEPEGGDAA